MAIEVFTVFNFYVTIFLAILPCSSILYFYYKTLQEFNILTDTYEQK